MRNTFHFAIFGFGTLVIASCSGNGPGSTSDTHSKGKTSIMIEESYKPLFDTSIYTFEGLNPKADIVPEYASEGKIIEAFFQNKTKTICISRDFTDKEKADLKKQQVEVRSDKIAQDAVALIVNPENKDTLITIDQLKRILTGKETKWKGLNTDINIVFDQENSANFNYLKNLCENENFSVNVFAVKSNEEVINYVKNNKSALGVIGVNWISDSDDFDALKFADGLSVMSVAKKENEEYFKPFSGLIHTHEYPLYREIWMINKAKQSGLNSGFIIFMTSDKGQTIALKSGLVPATQPIRLIQMTTE